MTNLDVIITIDSIQLADEEKFQSQVITKGVFCPTIYGYSMEYDETDATGFEGAHTTLRVYHNNKMELIRSGSVGSELIIEQGKKNYGTYGTPYGNIMVGVYGKSVDTALTPSGGRVDAKYVLDANSSLIGEYEITIEVRPAN